MIGNVLPFLQDKQINHLYILIDGALVDGFYDKLAQVDKLHYKSLLMGTMDMALAPLGPILLEIDPILHQELVEELLEIQTQYATPIWLNTEITFTSLFNKLRNMLYVEKEDGSQYFFRYYDQLCFSGFLSITHKNPYYAYTMKRIQWAIWQSNEERYQYYNKQGELI